MTIEKLTEDERTYLRRCMGHPSVLKAVRIIDQQTRALEGVAGAPGLLRVG